MYLIKDGNAQWYWDEDKLDMAEKLGYEVYEIQEVPYNAAAKTAAEQSEDEHPNGPTGTVTVELGATDAQ